MDADVGRALKKVICKVVNAYIKLLLYKKKTCISKFVYIFGQCTNSCCGVVLWCCVAKTARMHKHQHDKASTNSGTHASLTSQDWIGW